MGSVKYSINWSVFMAEKQCLLRGTDWNFQYYAEEF